MPWKPEIGIPFNHGVGLLMLHHFAVTRMERAHKYSQWFEEAKMNDRT